MAYKTLALKLYRPSGKKRRMIDQAMMNYTLALRRLLAVCREKVEALARSGEPVSRKELLSLPGREMLRDLNEFDAQPFKDSLVMEFAAVSLLFIAQFRRNAAAKYPEIYLGPDDFRRGLGRLVEEFDAGKISRDEAESEYGRLSLRFGRIHPFYFGRYSSTRDFCLLHDDNSGRFYAKLYLLNHSHAVDSGQEPGKLQLRVIAPGMPEAPPAGGKIRYIVVPLAFGKYQLAELNRVLENPKMLRTAHLKKVKNDYYLLLHIECGAAGRMEAKSRMGIARGFGGGLCYTVETPDGEIADRGIIEKEEPEEQELYLLSRKILRLCKKYRPQVILEAYGGKNDGLPFGEGGNEAPMKTSRYARLCGILKLRLAEQGLPAPVVLGANGLFISCPRCGRMLKKSRITSALFACVECGYAAPVEQVGSLNLVRRLSRYGQDRVPVYHKSEDGKEEYFNPNIGFECSMPAGSPDLSRMYLELKLYVGEPSRVFQNSKKFAILRKLRESPDIRKAVRIVEAGGKERMH